MDAFDLYNFVLSPFTRAIWVPMLLNAKMGASIQHRVSPQRDQTGQNALGQLRDGTSDYHRYFFETQAEALGITTSWNIG